MKEEELDKWTEEIATVIYNYQSELSDGFEYYQDYETWYKIKKEIKAILRTAIGETKR